LWVNWYHRRFPVELTLPGNRYITIEQLLELQMATIFRVDDFITLLFESDDRGGLYFILTALWLAPRIKSGRLFTDLKQKTRL